MFLSTPQLQTLKTAIQNETDPTFADYRTNGQTYAMANWFNGFPAVDTLLWNKGAKVVDIYDQITWDKYTPTDAADGSSTAFLHRAAVIQIKQLNLLNMLARDFIDATKANVRLGIRDAVVQIPSGVNGGMTSAAGGSGVNVLNAMTRKATRGEIVFLGGLQLVGTPTSNPVVSAYIPTLEGPISNENIVDALAV